MTTVVVVCCVVSDAADILLGLLFSVRGVNVKPICKKKICAKNIASSRFNQSCYCCLFVKLLATTT